MVEYHIKSSGSGFTFCFPDNIFMQFKQYDLTDDEMIEYISDSLTHEHIHKILYELFNNVVSKLFDSIEDNFRNDELHRKLLVFVNKEFLINSEIKNDDKEWYNNRESLTYKQFIEKYGFKQFLVYYGLTYNDTLIAKKLTNLRDKPKAVFCW